MSIQLRPTLGLTDDDEVLIHMGAGGANDVIKAALLNYYSYQGLAGREHGMFSVSLFAAIDGVTKEEILEELPHKRFGESRYGEIREVAELLPTTVDGPFPQRIREVHYDLVLVGAESLNPDVRFDEIPATDRQAYAEALKPHVTQVLGLFLPRTSKYDELREEVPDA